MDIISRLKKFITYIAVPVTQFADNCKIPRPTLSQLLNGRNKKVSDELISKIHLAYPDLSMLWLMFGEGDMLNNKFTQFSEPQNGSLFDNNAVYSTNKEQITSHIDFENSFSPQEQESLESNNDSDKPSVDVVTSQKSTDARASQATITFNPYEKKKIVNIIVYYDDNSFESFLPKDAMK